MTTNTRVASLEKTLQSQALAHIEKKYGLNERDLDASAKLKVLCDKIHAAYSDAVESLVEAINEHPGSSSDFIQRMDALWAAAGLDRKKQYSVAHTLAAAFDIPSNVTIETLLELDRQVYEACRIDESESE